MVGLMVMVAIMMILSTVTFQAWGDTLRRDNEAEMMFRAREIARALQLYQKDRGTLPTKMEQLIEPGSKGQYFLRKKYKDPLVKDGKWGLLFLAPGGGIYDPNGEEGGLDANGNPVISPVAPGGTGGSPFGGASQSGFGNNSGFGTNNSNNNQGSGGSALQRMGQNTGGRPGSAFGQRDQQPATGGFDDEGGGTRRSAFGNSAGQAGESGLPIAGVKSLCTDKPFRVFREQEDYAKWLFAFNDQDMQPPPLPGQAATPPQFRGQQPGQFPGQLSNPNQNRGAQNLGGQNPGGMTGRPNPSGGGKP